MLNMTPITSELIIDGMEAIAKYAPKMQVIRTKILIPKNAIKPKVVVIMLTPRGDAICLSLWKIIMQTPITSRPAVQNLTGIGQWDLPISDFILPTL